MVFIPEDELSKLPDMLKVTQAAKLLNCTPAASIQLNQIRTRSLIFLLAER